MYYLNGLDDFVGLEALGSTAACKAGDCDCMYGKIVKAITFFNAPNKSAKEYSSYRKTFEKYQTKYNACMKALGKTPIQTDINTPPPGSGIILGQPAGAGAATAAGATGAQSFADDAVQVQSLLQQQGVIPGQQAVASGGMSQTMKIGLAVGGAVILGSLLLMMTGKKKSLIPAVAASPVPGVIPATVKIRRVYVRARRSSRRSYRRRR